MQKFKLCFLKIAMSFLCVFAINISQSFAQHESQSIATSSNTLPKINPEQALQNFATVAKQINTTEIERAATQQNGRIKPFDTLARESILFLLGKYTKWDLSSTQIYLGLMATPESSQLEVVEIRNLELRQNLGFLKSKKYYSLAELETSTLSAIAERAFKLQEENAKALSEADKKIIEAYHQMTLLQEIISGDHFFSALDFSLFTKKMTDQTHSPSPLLQEAFGKYFQSLKNQNQSEIDQNAKYVVEISRGQETPDILKHYLHSLDAEIIFNKAQFFFWAFVISMFSATFFLGHSRKKILQKKSAVMLFLFSISPLVTGLAYRVYITEFAPVTNMYGTMIWVSLGIQIFTLLLFLLYQNYLFSGFMLLGSGIILWITQSIPLVLNPDLDPIVAVLRNNFWLSTHVTTITVSYAALTMAMILGNVALIRIWFIKDNQKFFKEYAHYAYRLIQLGCFLLTAGIILGGIWADYSWGRFWGWDPKETWSLIANLAFLAILHARYTGWVSDFAILAWSPVAYLMVIMAWYGVNFILAAGLHSYGFSSGGALAIAVFVIVQLFILLASFAKIKIRKTHA
jgi:ABC-type transport system involved in cytochrome c biogenesis permease subunit